MISPATAEAFITKKSEMSIAPGGLIHQTIVRDPVDPTAWDKDNSIMFNVQLINALVFETLLGVGAPRTPITPALYSKYGFPFFKLEEEKSGIKGVFGDIKSVAELYMKKGKKRCRSDSMATSFPVVILDKSTKKRPFVPVAELIQMLEKFNVMPEIR